MFRYGALTAAQLAPGFAAFVGARLLLKLTCGSTLQRWREAQRRREVRACSATVVAVVLSVCPPCGPLNTSTCGPRHLILDALAPNLQILEEYWLRYGYQRQLSAFSIPSLSNISSSVHDKSPGRSLPAAYKVNTHDALSETSACLPFSLLTHPWPLWYVRAGVVCSRAAAVP